MANFKITLSYDGTRYSGFQLQENANTIQAEVEKALAIIYGRPIRISGAGRTDSGVHAKGQVFSFHADGRVPAKSLPSALKGLLPRDIVAWQGEAVGEGFHARFSPSRKVYCYTVDNAPFPDVFLRRFAYHFPTPLNLEAMGQAALYLVGEHDFSAFRAASSDTRGSVRKLEDLSVSSEGNLIRLVFRADGFLYKMVRIMVGTLLKVGEGKIEPEKIPNILALCSRDQAGPTAPPHGLCLEQVIYE
jgi:tRNA pseudouridine38-40 synthase